MLQLCTSVLNLRSSLHSEDEKMNGRSWRDWSGRVKTQVRTGQMYCRFTCLMCSSLDFMSVWLSCHVEFVWLLWGCSSGKSDYTLIRVVLHTVKTSSFPLRIKESRIERQTLGSLELLRLILWLIKIGLTLIQMDSHSFTLIRKQITTELWECCHTLYTICFCVNTLALGYQ